MPVMRLKNIVSATIPAPILAVTLAIAAGAMLAACTATEEAAETSKQQLILGAWRAASQGQTVTLVYREEQVEVREFGMNFTYAWLDDDHIRLDALGQEVITRVDFDSPDVMRQTSRGITQLLHRVP